jgi:phosphatidylinositol kinase/protein kinase (PI-3  family)
MRQSISFLFLFFNKPWYISTTISPTKKNPFLNKLERLEITHTMSIIIDKIDVIYFNRYSYIIGTSLRYESNSIEYSLL